MMSQRNVCYIVFSSRHRAPLVGMKVDTSSLKWFASPHLRCPRWFRPQFCRFVDWMYPQRWRCLRFSHRQCGGHSCLASETVHASHLQRTTRGHFDQNVLELTEVSAVPAEVVDAKTVSKSHSLFTVLTCQLQAHRTMSTSCRKSSMRKWRKRTFLRSVQSSLP